MGETAIQPINAADVSPGSSLSAALLALNNAHAQELSWLEPDRLQHLVRGPLVEATPAAREKIEAAMRQVGLLN